MTPDPATRALTVALLHKLDDDGYLDPHIDAPAFYDAVDKLTPLIAAALTEPFASEAKRDPADPREARLREALRALAVKVGCVPSRLEPDGHDALCESEYIAPLGDTPCDCQARKDMVRAALASPPPDETGVADAGASGRSTTSGRRRVGADEMRGGRTHAA